MLTRSLNRASAMEFALSSDICGMGKFRRVKYAEVMLHSSGINLCLPFRASMADTKKTRKIARGRGFSVLSVLGARNKAQVLYSIVASDAIHMVNVFTRQAPFSIYPSKSMGQVQSAKNLNLNIPMSVSCSGGISDADALVRSTPHKNASLWVVVKQFAQTLCGKIGLSHDTVPSLIGQRPARVISTGGLRYFTTRACSCAAGITKCLHEAALVATAVCMPANYRRLLNPLGALTPFNAL